MSKEALREELERRIQALGSRIEQDERQLRTGAPEEKVEAAGELAALRDRQRELEQRLARIAGTDISGAGSELREEMLDLETAVNRWARKYY